ncbi:MAG: hypothetical protein WCO98_16435, partial [bacterium]
LMFDGERFLGIGEVRYQHKQLRSAQLPWIVYTESEHGFRFEPNRLIDVEHDGDAVTLVFAGDGTWLPRLQEADAMGDCRVATRRVANPSVTFKWSFRPITENIYGNEWPGLAMQVAVEAPGQPIHWLIEDTTWELGGNAKGCTLIQQDVSAIDLEQSVKEGSAFSTIEKFFTDGWGGAYPMDMLPRCAGSAQCDFQVKDDLAMCIYSERPGLTRARIDKFANEDVIHYTDRPFFKLGESVSAPERKLVVFQSGQTLKKHEWRNLWLDVFTYTRQQILAEYDFQLETPRPSLHAHLWDDDLKARGATWTNDLKAALPAYSKLGYRDVFTHGVWDSITSDPKLTSADGNICCPYRFRYAEMFGGDASMKALGDIAKSVGMGIFQWYSFHLSKLAPIWKEHPEWVLHEANGDQYDANYGSLWAGRLNSPYGQWFEADIKHSCTAAGTAGIFWDSYQNLGLTAVDWGSADKCPQADIIWDMQSRQQKMGLRHRCEITTIFGVSQVAMFGFAADKFRRRLWDDAVAGDWAFSLIDTSPGFFSNTYAFGTSRLNADQYFWLTAHRCIPGIGARPWESSKHDGNSPQMLPGGDQIEEFARVNHIFNKCEPLMHRLRLTEGGNYVIWENESGQPAVIWAFKDVEVNITKPFTAKAGEVYVIGEDGVAEELIINN